MEKMRGTGRAGGQLAQALAMALMLQWRPGGLAAPVATAWLCASLDGTGIPWGMLLGAAVGSACSWPMQAQAAILPMLALMAALARPEGYPALIRVLLAGLLTLAEAVTASRLDVAAAPVWLLGALSAAICAVPMIAAVCVRPEGQASEQAPSADEPARRPNRNRAARSFRSGWRPGARLTVGLAESASAAEAAAGQGVSGTLRKRPAQRRLDRGAAMLGRWLAHLAVAAGAAAALGSEWGVLAAGLSVAFCREEGGMALSVLLAAALAALGTPIAASGSLCALWVGMSLMDRWGQAAAALGGLAAAGLWLLSGGPSESVWYLAALAPAGLVCAGRPKTRSRARRLMDAQALMERQAGQMRRRLTALSGVLSDMAQGYGSGLDPPREDELLANLRTRLCDGCDRYERCWNGRAGEGTRLLCELISESVSGTLPGRATPDMMRLCGRAERIPDRLYGILRKFAENRSACMARMDGVQRARLSISTAADMVRTMSETCTDSRFVEGAALRRLERLLRGRGLKDVTAVSTGEGLVLISPDGWTESARRVALSACEDVWGLPWSDSDFRSGTALALRPAAALTVHMGCDAIALETGGNGDSIRMEALDDRRWMAVLSDGMGVGAAAARESERVVTAIGRFLRAGLPPEQAAALANQLLLSEGRSDMFATLDLCVIDGWRREATLVKMAACDSFLLRGGEASVIAGGRLPLGILSEAAPQTTVMEIQPGDVIVMGTDGAMDGLDRQTVAKCFPAQRGVDARALARALRQAGDERRIHADDQTLAVIRIEDMETQHSASSRSAGAAVRTRWRRRRLAAFPGGMKNFRAGEESATRRACIGQKARRPFAEKGRGRAAGNTDAVGNPKA